MALGGCGSSELEQIETETAAILARTPIGTPFGSLAPAMAERGYACTQGVRQVVDRTGLRDGEPHLTCEREEARWFFCTKRTRAHLLQFQGRLSNVLVNIGTFC